MKGSKLIVPKSLRRGMLRKYQTGHLGIETCRQRASQIMYWPGIKQSIEEKSKVMRLISAKQTKTTVEPLLPNETAKYT